MTLSPEIGDFYRRWMEKANNHGRDNLSDYFDSYFSLFAAFNRLYAEATFILARKGALKLARRTSFPDAEAAKTYVLKYLGSRYYLEKLERNQEAKLGKGPRVRSQQSTKFSKQLRPDPFTRKPHYQIQKVSMRENDHFLFLIQQKKQSLKK